MKQALICLEHFDRWWNNRPEPHISAPKESCVHHEKIMAAWICGWNAALTHKEQIHHEPK